MYRHTWRHMSDEHVIVNPTIRALTPIILPSLAPFSSTRPLSILLPGTVTRPHAGYS